MVAGVAVPGGAGAAVAGAWDGGRVRVERGTGGGGGHRAAVVCLGVSGGAGVVVAGAGCGGWVWAGGVNGEPGGACGGRGRWTWGGGGVPGGVGGTGSGGGGGWGWGSCMAGGERGRSTWGGGRAPGGARGSGSGRSEVSGGRGGTWGSGSGASGWLRRGGGVGSVGAVRMCAMQGGERERRRLQDRASSLESGQSGGVGGSWAASRGAAWYWGGGGVSLRPWIRHVGVWWRQRLVVWVE